MNLSKQIINKQLEEIANEYFTSKEIAKNYSSAYDSFTDGTNDLKIDGLYFGEPSDDVLDISLFQIKYSLDFTKDKGFKENDIIGLISTLRNMFGDLSKFEIAQSLNIKLNEINSYISMGNIPSIKVYLVNNGITIVCSNAEYAPSSQSTNTIIKLTDAQIINGGQTSKTIQNVICDNKNKNEDFSQTYVLARIYKINDLNNINKNLIDKITLSTNSQNAIKSSDLRANDTIQQNIEIGLAKYDIKYIRRRDNKRAKKGDIRKEIVAEVILSAILKRPNEAKYKKALHFGMLYKEIFNERIINIEMIISLVKQFTYIETKRKTASNELLSNYPFIPYATYHILMEFYQIASDDSFEADYINVLSIIKEKFKLLGIDMSKSLDIISVLKSNRLNG